MARGSVAEDQFRMRLREERERRNLSQADVAKRLGDMGVDGIYATTIAKMENGERAVRVDEAAAIADLFETSVDVLTGREMRPGDEQESLYLTALLDATRQAKDQLFRSRRNFDMRLIAVVGDEIGDFFTDDAAHAVMERGQNVSLSMRDLEHDLRYLEDGIVDYLDSKRQKKQRKRSREAQS